jgi:hypothetical protein
MERKGDAATQSQDDLEVLISEQLGSGKNRTDVVRNLVASGMTESEANQAVERIYFQLKKSVEEEEFSGEVLVPVLLGGLIAAVIGGVVWGAIAIWTGYEIGYVAWGVGLLCGLGVVMLSQGKRGMPLQVIAVAASVLGIVIGKYGTYQHIFQESLMAMENGAAIAAEFSLFSVGMIQLFMADLSNMVGGFDLLWIGLAVYTAWSIPKASGLKI